MSIYTEEYYSEKSINGKSRYTLNESQADCMADVQQLIDGVSIVIHSVNAQDIGEANKKPIAHTLEINHCRAGRFCCKFDDNTERRIVPGEISVDLLSHKTTKSWFPDGKYSGISIVVEIPKAQSALNRMLEAVTQSTFDLTSLEKAIKNSGGIILTDVERNEALFSSLYLSATQPQDVALQRLRVLEILAHVCHGVSDMQQNKQEYNYDRQIFTVRDYLLEHSKQHITLKQLAERFDMSQTSLKQRFFNAFGTTADRYMRRYRLQTAENLLLTTNRNISDIAQEVGFQSTSVFSVRFSQQFGLPPGQYRQFSQKITDCDKSNINSPFRELNVK